MLKGKKCGDCEVIAILDTGVKLRVPLRVDAGNVSFDPDTGEFIRYWYKEGNYTIASKINGSDSMNPPGFL